MAAVGVLALVAVTAGGWWAGDQIESRLPHSRPHRGIDRQVLFGVGNLQLLHDGCEPSLRGWYLYPVQRLQPPSC